MMIFIKRPFEEVMAALPVACATTHPTTKEPVLIKRGLMGYWPFNGVVAVFNAKHKVTTAQERAMRYGSIFGFDKVVADPLNHEEP